MWYLYGFVLLAGIANAIQAGQNSTLSRGLDESLTAGILVATVAGLCILTAGAVSGRLAWPNGAQIAAMPWWGWFGGVLGGGVILAQLLLARQVGAAPFMALLVTAGVVTSILLDHFGWIGFERHPAGLWRLLGAFLMVAGVALIAVF